MQESIIHDIGMITALNSYSASYENLHVCVHLGKCMKQEKKARTHLPTHPHTHTHTHTYISQNVLYVPY